MAYTLPPDPPGKNPQKGTAKEYTPIVYYEGSITPIPAVRSAPPKPPAKKVQP